MKFQRGPRSIESPPEISDIRPIARADLAHLTEKREPKTLQSIRDNHHRIAMAIADGLSDFEVASLCGVSIGRVRTLKADPSMQELIAHYRAMKVAKWVDEDAHIAYLKQNALKAQAMLSDKLDEAADKGEFLPTRDLLGIAELGLDRTGYGKVNKNVNVNVDFAARLETARQRADRARETREPGAMGGVATSRQPHAPPIVIDGTGVPLSPAVPRSEGEQQPVASQRFVSTAPLPPSPRQLRRL